MTKYRIYLLSLLTVSWIFLCGLNPTADNQVSAEEPQETATEPTPVEIENAYNALETKQIKTTSNFITVNTKQTAIKSTDASTPDQHNRIKSSDPEKPLDLTIPFNGTEKTDIKPEQKSVDDSQMTNYFDPQTKKKLRPLELNGGFLMSPEPELEKRKSVDGAGIVINLKP